MEQLQAQLDFLGTPLDVYSVSGAILESRARDITQISAEKNIYGAVTDINSRHDALQEFWIKTDTGDEIPISVTGTPIAARIGHRVSVLFAAESGGSAKTIIGIKNHTSGQTFVTANRHQRLPVRPRFFQQSLMHLLGPGAVTIVTVLSGLVFGIAVEVSKVGSFGTVAILAGATISAAFFYQHAYCERRAKQFFADLNRLVESS